LIGELIKEHRETELLQRIRELSDMKMRTFTIGGVYYGATERVRRLIDAARTAHQIGDFDHWESACEAAEAEMSAQQGRPQSDLLAGDPV
jgi:hypothetical protein